MEPIKEALTFDDVLLLPQYSSILPANTNLNVKLSKTINLKLPFFIISDGYCYRIKNGNSYGKKWWNWSNTQKFRY